MNLSKRSRIRNARLGAVACMFAVPVLTACNGDNSNSAVNASLVCDDTLKTSFKPDAQTSVVAVKAFKKGDPLVLGDESSGSAQTAANDVCMVKLSVGPGNAGPAGAPSTSAGIGIEIWLPSRSNWNGRVHAIGGSGWQGGTAGSATAIASVAAASVAGNEGAVSSTTDTGHTIPGVGSFAMNPDGTINSTLWTDFASRAVHEQAVKTKALAAAYYGRVPKFSYWDGGSTGGRQGLNLAQNNPNDFDGIIALYPAINWTRFITSELYPQIVFQRDLGGTPLSTEQEDLVSNAAIAACDITGGQHLGYIIDPSSCAYDPLKDPNVLCVSDGGTNATSACVTRTQAQVVNKIWYGMTADSSVPDPAVDNGWSQASSTTLMGNGNHRWFGLTRGTAFYSPFFLGLANPNQEFIIASDMVALELQNPTVAGTGFTNATGNGQSLWKQLSYVQLSNAYDRGVALQSEFGGINTDNPDLSAFRNRGGKLLTYHGLADELIAPQGTINYYNRVAAQMGSMAAVQNFYRLYLVPGLGHSTPNGTSNPAAIIPNFAPGQMYSLLTDWVEKGAVPDKVTLQATSGNTTRSMPICVYPKKITFVSGNPTVAASYDCL
ncbi:tannase/feruloyl esterase family alpha/beta hydrolase [Burkholderia sp. BCC1993]|uniref:tannase/feruloyl esterase family alpha/beta hydrolase n=1 Tax=Burkholderia sp. BCC1993 TaxID=2817444 RepID=UPI002AB00696|nr:tannase/feruloyl esterase family alpha/beta hydrolase [Burkholderia sp. BCC1993]